MPISGDLLKLAISQGIWAALFLSLLYYVLKENGKRESKLHTVIESLCDRLDVVDDIKRCVEDIKKDLDKK